MLITLLLKKHSDPVNTHARWLPTPNHVAKDGESKPHTTPPRVPSLCPGQASALSILVTFFCLLCPSSSYILADTPAGCFIPRFSIYIFLPFLLIIHPPSVLFLFPLKDCLLLHHPLRMKTWQQAFVGGENIPYLLHTLTSLSLNECFHSTCL